MDPIPSKRRNGNKNTNETGSADANDLAKGVCEFTQLALWTAASLAGMVTALLIARRPFFESLIRSTGGGKRAPAAAGAGRGKRQPSRPSPQQSLPMLADAIVGNTKAAVASVFGPPRSAALRGVVRTGKGPGFWQANTWYYPLPRKDALAMAIEFDDDAARRVEFFRAPGL